MLRHSSSFFLSLLIHAALLGLAFFTYKYTFSPSENTPQEKIVCVNLCCVVESEAPPIKKVEPKKQQQVKKTTPPKQEVPKKFEEVKKIQEVKEAEIVEEIVKEEVIPTVVKEQKRKVEPQEVKLVKENAHTEVKEPQIEKKSPSESYVDENLEKIVQLLQENLYYPRRARKRGIEGKVLVSFHLSIRSQVSGIKVLSSKNEILSRAAVETIENLSGKFPAPKEDLTLSIPITYTLK